MASIAAFIPAFVRLSRLLAVGAAGTRRRVRYCVLAVLVAAGSVSAVEVEEVRWGFDGRAVPERINLLSVLLRNADARPYEDGVALHREQSVGQRLGARLVEPCYIAPFTSRWVQFYPYVSEGDERWVLTVGRRGRELPRPKLGAPAAVYLTDAERSARRASGIRAFPANLFPSTVTATDGLSAAVLDHPPRWEPARRQAFVDWLRRGGTVHVLLDESGAHPQFSAELSLLNDANPRCRVGAGLVVRHAVSRSDVDGRYLAERGFSAPTLEEGSAPSIWKTDSAILRNLKGLVRPDHNWALIYLALVAYMIVVGPINYLVGRKIRDFRPAVLFFLVSFIGFAGLLSALGRRGYGETSAVHALSYARPVGEATYDVTQWINVFAVRGAQYTITHPGGHNLYSTCQDFEAVAGAIRNGLGGTFVVDVPLYSSRAFLHRGRMPGHVLGLQVAEWHGEDRLQSVVLAVGADFPEKTIEMWALHRDRFYRVARAEGRLEVRSPRRSLDTFLAEDQLRLDEYMPLPYRGYDDGGKDPEEVCRDMFRLLVARAIGGTDSFRHYVAPPPSPNDTVQLFIFAESPEGFRLSDNRFGQETGYVLYHLYLRRPEESRERNE